VPGVPRELIEHTLNVDPKARPVKQPLQRFDKPKRKAIAAELHRLENAGFIREIKTSTWASKPVVSRKKNTDMHRVCVDYTSLNKHCPKDPFVLPHIDQIIDSTAHKATSKDHPKDRHLPPHKDTSNGRIRGELGHMLRICRSRGQDNFIKRSAPGIGAGEAGPRQRHGHYEAGYRAARPEHVTRPMPI
jgi:hypothetical protein